MGAAEATPRAGHEGVLPMSQQQKSQEELREIVMWHLARSVKTLPQCGSVLI